MSEHSLNGPSSFARRIACPGSANAERGIHEETSVYAAEGTAAHKLCETCLKDGIDPQDMIGKVIGGFEVDQEMADAAEMYVNYCRDLIQDATVYGVEERLPLPFIGKTEKGTSDFVAVTKDKKLYAVDFKYGKGVAVDAVDNVQGLCYGLGAARKYHNHAWDSLTVVIIQPRASHPDGPIREWSISREDAEDYVLEFATAAEATRPDDAPRRAGGHCKFCKAKPTCPAAEANASAIAESQFGSVEDIEGERLSELVLDRIPVILDWCKSVQDYAQKQAEAGNAPPGTKLVPTRATRKWVDEGNAETVIVSETGLATGDIYTSKMKSPAQIEKLVGKKNMGPLRDHIESKSTGVTLVPSSDPREAAKVSATDQFGSAT